MKHLIYITAIFLILGIWLTSCRTQQLTSNAETKYDSIVIEKLIPYALPEDSAKIRALLECDENGKIVLKWFDEEHTKRMRLQFSLDSLGYLMTTAKTELDTVYLPHTIINVGKNRISQSIATIYIEKKLSWWKVALIWTGGIVWLIAIIALVYWTNQKTYLLNKLWILIKR